MDRGTASRLKQARGRAGFDNATAAAIRFGWIIPTYLAHENGSRGFGIERAQLYAHAFKVDPAWLLTGQGRPSPTDKVKITGYVGAGGLVYMAEEMGGPGALEAVDLPPGDYGEFGIFKVRGTFYYPAYRDNELLFVRMAAGAPVEHVNRDCIVGTDDGRCFLKTIIPGSKEGRFTLLAFSDPPILDVCVQWAWPVEWVRKP